MSLLENLIATTVATSEISESDLLFVFSKGERRIYHAGEYLFQEGAPRLWVGIIEEGQVELVRGERDAHTLISILPTGSIIAESAMTGDDAHDVSGYTRNGATVWQVPIEMLKATFQIHPEIYYRFVARFALKQRYAADHLGQSLEALRKNYDTITKEGWLSKDVLDYILKTK